MPLQEHDEETLRNNMNECDRAVSMLIEHGINDMSTRVQREELIKVLIQHEDVVQFLIYSLILEDGEAAKKMLAELRYWEAKQVF